MAPFRIILSSTDQPGETALAMLRAKLSLLPEFSETDLVTILKTLPAPIKEGISLTEAQALCAQIKSLGGVASMESMDSTPLEIPKGKSLSELEKSLSLEEEAPSPENAPAASTPPRELVPAQPLPPATPPSAQPPSKAPREDFELAFVFDTEESPLPPPDSPKPQRAGKSEPDKGSDDDLILSFDLDKEPTPTATPKGPAMETPPVRPTTPPPLQISLEEPEAVPPKPLPQPPPSPGSPPRSTATTSPQAQPAAISEQPLPLMVEHPGDVQTQSAAPATEEPITQPGEEPIDEEPYSTTQIEAAFSHDDATEESIALPSADRGAPLRIAIIVLLCAVLAYLVVLVIQQQSAPQVRFSGDLITGLLKDQNAILSGASSSASSATVPVKLLARWAGTSESNGAQISVTIDETDAGFALREAELHFPEPRKLTPVEVVEGKTLSFMRSYSFSASADSQTPLNFPLAVRPGGTEVTFSLNGHLYAVDAENAVRISAPLVIRGHFLPDTNEFQGVWSITNRTAPAEAQSPNFLRTGTASFSYGIDGDISLRREAVPEPTPTPTRTSTPTQTSPTP